MKSVEKKRSRLGRALLGSALLLGITTAAYAEETEFSLDQVVVTALRVESKDLDTPATVHVYTAEELQATGAVNLFDALRFTTGIHSYSYGPGGQAYGAMNAKIAIRGWDRGTVILIDGAPINLNNTYFIETLPMESIERVEIVKGAASVLYGNDASGGVINIITKQSPANSISATFGEYGQRKQSLTFTDGGFSLSATKEQKDLLKGFSNSGLAFGDSDKKTIMWKYKINDQLSFMHQHIENDYGHKKFQKTGNVIDWNTVTEDSVYQYKEDYMRLQYTGELWKISLYGNQSDRDTVRYKDVHITPVLDKSDRTKFWEVGMDAQTEWKSSFAQFVGGVSVSVQDYDCDNRGGNKRITGNRDSYSLFLQAITDLGNDLSFISGVRQEWVDTDLKDYSEFCPQFQLIKKLDDENSLYINAAKSFSMPTFSNLYGSAAPIFEPNPNLEPETGWAYEAGWKSAGDNSMLKFAVYHMDFTTIAYQSVGLDKNVPFNYPFKNTGMEISYDKHLSNKFSYAVGASYGNPKIQTKNGWNRRYARQQFTGSVKYGCDKWKASLTGSVTADRAGDWKNMIPVNLNVNYAMSDNSSIEMAVENIFDRKDIIGNWSSATSTEYYSLPRNVRIAYTQRI